MIVTGTYDPVLVALSIAVAIMASYAALELGGRVLASEGWRRILWLTMAAVAMGGGIWSMHFIAMLAFALPIPVEYDFELTVLSLLAAIVATGAGFYVVAGNPQRRSRIAFGGTLIGAGIVGMHYTGMSAMLMQCSLRYDLPLVVASIVIAVGAATTALWLAFRVRGAWRRLGAAALMGAAVSGMHYTGMAAAIFSPTTPAAATVGYAGPEHMQLALGVAALTFIILFMALLASAQTLARQRGELIEADPNGVLVVDSQSRIETVNGRLTELFGYRQDELLGQAVELLLPERYRRSHVALRAGYNAAPATRPMGAGRDLQGLRKDGSEFPIEIGLSPVTTERGVAVIATVVDITQRKTAEQRLSQLASIVEFSRDAILSQSLDGTITSWNPAAETLLGYSAAEMIGTQIGRIVPAGRLAEEDEILDRLKTGQSVGHYDTERIAKDGRPVPVSITVSPIKDRTGALIGVSKAMRDISDRKAAEEKERILVSELQHRTNNLLAVIQAIADRSLSGPGSIEQMRWAFGARLQALSRAYRRLVNSNWGGVALKEIVRSTLEPFGGRIDIDGSDITFGAKETQDFSLAIHELATNAVKHGALSNANGKIKIGWTVIGNGGDAVLRFRWQERGGPPVDVPKRQGFGSSLLRAAFRDISIDYAREGLICEIRVPLGNIEFTASSAAAVSDHQAAKTALLAL